MNTRSFIKSLALLSGAAVGCPGIFIPKFEPVRWKVQRYIVALNPDWLGAPIEIPITNWADFWLKMDPMPYPEFLGRIGGRTEGYPLVEINQPTKSL